MTALQDNGGCHKATEEQDDRETLGKEIWRGNCGQQVSVSAGGRWRWQHKTELDGVQWLIIFSSLVCGLCSTGIDRA